MTDNQVDHPAVITHTSRHTQREIMVPLAVRVVSEQARHESPQRRVSATASMSDKRIVTSVKIWFARPSQSSQSVYGDPRITCNLVVADFLFVSFGNLS